MSWRYSQAAPPHTQSTMPAVSVIVTGNMGSPSQRCSATWTNLSTNRQPNTAARAPAVCPAIGPHRRCTTTEVIVKATTKASNSGSLIHLWTDTNQAHEAFRVKGLSGRYLRGLSAIQMPQRPRPGGHSPAKRTPQAPHAGTPPPHDCQLPSPRESARATRGRVRE